MLSMIYSGRNRNECLIETRFNVHEIICTIVLTSCQNRGNNIDNKNNKKAVGLHLLKIITPYIKLKFPKV